MSIDPKELEKLNRDELMAKAQQLGAIRPELLTRPELRDEIIRLSESDESERRRARGWFGVARDLVASVVNQGLNLPDAVDLIRSANVLSQKGSPPVATVTLAEIYAAQGHVRKALDLLDEVLANEPDHEAARLARSRWSQQTPNGVRGANSGDAEKEPPTVEVPVLAVGQEVPTPQDPGSGAASELAEGAVTDVTAPRTDAELEDRAGLDATTEGSGVSATLSSVDGAEPSTSSEGLVDGAEPTSSEGLVDGAEPSTSSSPPPSRATTSRGEEVSEAAIGAGAEGTLGDVPADSERSPRATIDVTGVAPIELHAASAEHAGPPSGRVPMMPDNMVEPAAPIDAPSRAGEAEPSSPSREPARLLEEQMQAPSMDKPRVLLVRTAANELHCCWCVSDERLQRLHTKEPKGRLVLRIVAVTAAWEGPKRREFDLDLPGTTGQQRVALTDSPTEVRLAMGWLTDQRFTVLEIGTEFAWDAQNGAQVRWAAPAAPREYLEQVGAAAVASMMRSVQAA